jgi:long-chain acyl-CoA synthetase
MNQNIFITGGTGMMGKEIVRLLLKNTNADIFLLVHKRGITDGNEEILENIFSLTPRKEFIKRLKVIRGDITKSQIGLDDYIYRALLKKTTHILHCAASTRFDLPLEEARKINVFGTKNIADFAQKCPNIRQFGFLSTVYVSGKRIGEIKEDELEHTAGFVNTYEQSKYEAEMLLSKLKNIPVAVYRLSTILGDSQSGKVNHFTAPHQAIRMMYLGLASMLPGAPDYKVDLISSDYTAKTIFDLYWKNFVPNKNFHITHGEGSYTLHEIIEKTYEVLAVIDKDWAQKNYPKPAIVSEETFDLFMRSASSVDNPILSGVLNALNHFAHQLLYPKEFSNRNTLAVLPNYRKKLPKIQEYYGKVVEYCVKRKWGKIQ